MSGPAIYSDHGTNDCTTRSHSYFGVATCAILIASALIAISVLPGLPLAAALVAAVLCGWSEADGACGTSHICTLTPTYRFDRGLWYRATLGYTAGGAITGSVVGGVLGLAGMPLEPLRIYSFPVVAGLTLVLIAREIGWLPFRLPQAARQTDKMWAMRFGVPTGATMWGAHIGLAFATVINHGGVFIIALLAILLGPLHGAMLMAVYWLGRTLPIWLSPVCFRGDHLPATLDGWISSNPMYFRVAAAAGLLLAGIAARILV